MPKVEKRIDGLGKELSTRITTRTALLTAHLRETPVLSGMAMDHFFDSMRIRQDSVEKTINAFVRTGQEAVQVIQANLLTTEGEGSFLRLSMEDCYATCEKIIGTGCMNKRREVLRQRFSSPAGSPFDEISRMAQEAYEKAFQAWGKALRSEHGWSRFTTTLRGTCKLVFRAKGRATRMRLREISK